nr:hypothetical protein [Tanacetum cinerariifolium]
PEWSRHVTIVHQTKVLHTADYTQLYDFLKYNQKEVDELKAERLAKIQDPLALMANSNNPYASPAPHQDLSPFNQNYLQQPMPNPEDITDSTTAMNMALALMAKAFKLNYSTPTNNNHRISSNPRNWQIVQPDRQMQMIGGNDGNQFRQYAGQNAGNLNGYNAVQNVKNQVAQNPRVQNVGNQNGPIGVQGNGNQNQIGNGNLVAVRAEGNAAGHNENQIRCYNCRGVGHFARDCTVMPRRRDVAYLQTQLLIAQKEEAGIQLQAEEYDLMAAAADLDEIEEVNANCILMANLQQASSSGTQTDKAPIYDSDGSAEYTELLKPIHEPQQVPQNDNNVISEVTDVEQGGETVEQHSANFEETRSLYDSLYHNLATEVEKVNSVNRKLKETNTDLITELARYKNQERYFEISQEKYDKLERCYQQSNRQIAQPGMNMGQDKQMQMVGGMNMGQDRQMQMIGGNGGNQFRQYAGQNAGNLNGYNAVQNVRNQNQIGNGNLVAVRAEGNAAGHNGNQIRCYNCRGLGHFARDCTVRPRRRDAAYLQTQLLIAQKEEAGIQLQAEEYDLMAAAVDLDEIKEANANCILMANLQQASSSGTQTDSAPVYDTDGSAEVHENCDNNEIFNMFTQEEQYTELLEPIPELHQISELNKQLSKEKSTVSFLLEEKRLKSDFKTYEDELLDKQILLEQKIKELNNIVVKTGQSIQTIHMLSPNPNSFYHTEQKMALDLSDDTTPSVARKFLNEVKSTIVTLQRVVKQRMTIETHNWASFANQEFHKIVRENFFPIVNQVDARVQNFKIQFLKEAAKFVGDFKSLVKEAGASLAKHKILELGIERLLKAVVSQDIIFVVQIASVVDTSDL